jgi:hypothetical protein
VSEEHKWHFGNGALGSWDVFDFRDLKVRDIGGRDVEIIWKMGNAAHVEASTDSECIYLTFTPVSEESS